MDQASEERSKAFTLRAYHYLFEGDDFEAIELLKQCRPEVVDDYDPFTEQPVGVHLLCGRKVHEVLEVPSNPIRQRIYKAFAVSMNNPSFELHLGYEPAPDTTWASALPQPSSGVVEAEFKDLGSEQA